MEDFRSESTDKPTVTNFLHHIDANEEDALKRGTVDLITALQSEARTAATDPKYLEKNYGHIAAEQRTPINDGSGDDLYLRGILYAVEFKKDAASTALTSDQFAKQQVVPSAEDSLQRMRFFGRCSRTSQLETNRQRPRNVGSLFSNQRR